MDIGREVKKIAKDFYSLKLLFREDREILYTTIEKKGKLFESNIDSKLRIYLPTKIDDLENYDRSFGYFAGFLALNAFQYMNFFIYPEKSLNRHSEIDNHDVQEESQETLGTFIERIDERLDTKVIIKIIKKVKRNHPLEMYPLLEFQIDFSPYYIGFRFETTQIKKSNINKDVVKDERRYYTRNRIKIPQEFLDFCEIELYKDKIVLFKLENEIEIWEKKRWEDFVNKKIWLSKAGKFIIEGRKGENNFIKTKEHLFVSLMMS